MKHLVLLGDSIFDNAAYVAGAPAVIDQVRNFLPGGWRATLLAVDGNVTADVRKQVDRMPGDATHLVMSVGGNDALGGLAQLHSPNLLTMLQALAVLAELQNTFASEYAQSLKIVCDRGTPVVCCTIYDKVPGLTNELRTALSLFNDVILRECARFHIPVLDLRAVCTDALDYSAISPIEPSNSGGQKIAARIVSIVTDEMSESRQCQVYA